MNTDLMFSSKTDLHATPKDFYDKLRDEFCFDYDPCATHENAKCLFYSTLEGTFMYLGDVTPMKIASADGLEHDWTPYAVFMNPPYGRGIGAWVKKAAERKAHVVVALLPARTDTKWWHDYIEGKADEVRFIKGRLRFGDAKNAAPFPSVVVVWHRRVDTHPQ